MTRCPANQRRCCCPCGPANCGAEWLEFDLDSRNGGYRPQFEDAPRPLDRRCPPRPWAILRELAKPSPAGAVFVPLACGRLTGR